MREGYVPNKEDAAWVIGFVKRRLIEWQLNGFVLIMTEDEEKACLNALNTIKQEVGEWLTNHTSRMPLKADADYVDAGYQT